MCRSRGVFALKPVVGPALLLACDLGHDELSPVSLRNRLLTVLTTASKNLPDELRLVFRGVLGMGPKISGRLTQERLQQLGHRIVYDVRTVRRRGDETAASSPSSCSTTT